MTTISSVFDYLKKSTPSATAQYLAGLPDCVNPNESSIRSVIQRLSKKLSSLRISATTPKGKANLDLFLNSPFPFPPKNEANREKARLVLVLF